jgi:hypothetical protein
VPAHLFGRAVALNQVTFEVGAVVGPAIGGLVYALAGHAGHVYLTSTAAYLVLTLLLVAMSRRPARTGKRAPLSLEALLAGVAYVGRTRLILGLISLDLFAGFFGGAVALMPVFARDVLEVGPEGLGLLRAAPSVGAVAAAVVLLVSPLRRSPGLVMLWSVAIFGAATIVFGASRSVALSLGALVVVGASDMVSVVIRQTLLQIATPDAVRGRVMAVNELAVNASNELGEVESGYTAGWWGAVPAVVIGGVAAIATVACHAAWFPALRNEGRRASDAAAPPDATASPKLRAAS